MSIIGKIQSLFSDREKTQPIFPITKTKAVSDDNGVSLDVLLAAKASESFVTNKIAEAQLGGGDGSNIVLSGFATKDELNAKADVEHSHANYATKDDVRSIDFPVDSVNSKTGAVTLGASDVGARPNTWLPTIAEIGAAPSGYGLGETSKNSADANTELTNGYFRTTSSTANSPYNHGAAHVRTYNASEVVQNIFRVPTGIELVRYTTDGGATWVEEYVNPPMTVGTEYNTTIRFNGKAVYTKLLDLGTLPASGQKSTWYFNGATNVWFEAYIVTSTGNTSLLPHLTSTGALNATVYASKQNIVVCAQTDLSENTGFAIVRYTKD